MKECFYDLMSEPGQPRNSEGSFLSLKNEDILFVYTRYAGISWQDHASADLAGLLSSDGGKTWRYQGVIIRKGDADNIMSVSLLRLQSGRILMSFLQKSNTANSVHPECVPLRCFSLDEGKTWSKPERVTPRHEYFVVNNDRIIQLKSGRLLMPFAYHKFDGHGNSFPAWAGIFYSDDEGETWKEAEQKLVPPESIRSGFQEPGVIELRDGRVMMWMRNDSGYQYKAFSADAGLTWSEPVPALEFPSPCAPLSMKRQPDGSLVAVWNNHPVAAEWFRRTPLVMAESTDDGQTWKTPEVVGSDPARGYCYTAILFPGNAVLLGYCFGKNESDHCCLQDLRIHRIER